MKNKQILFGSGKNRAEIKIFIPKGHTHPVVTFSGDLPELTAMIIAGVGILAGQILKTGMPENAIKDMFANGTAAAVESAIRTHREETKKDL